MALGYPTDAMSSMNSLTARYSGLTDVCYPNVNTTFDNSFIGLSVATYLSASRLQICLDLRQRFRATCDFRSRQGVGFTLLYFSIK